jgi:hypothetical protein
MSLFESLHGRKCNTLVSWDNPIDREVVGIELLKEMEEYMARIKHNLKVSQDRKKSCVEKNKAFRYFKVREHLFLKVKVKRSSLILGSFPKLQEDIVDPFKYYKI